MELAFGDDNPERHSLTFPQPMLPGSTVLVFVSDMNLNGNPTGTGTPPHIVITDSDNGNYVERLTVNDSVDWDDTKVFTRTNMPPGMLSVTAAWETNQWHAFMVVEIANVAAEPSIKAVGALNHSASQAPDAVSSGQVAVGDGPALVIGYGQNNYAALGGQSTPGAGTGFTPLASGANWQGKEGMSFNPASLLEAARFAAGGHVATTFTSGKPASLPENFVAIAVSIQ
jgi:hypothetical protein